MHMSNLREMREHCRVVFQGISPFVYMVKRKITNTSNYKMCHVSVVGIQIVVVISTKDLEWGQPFYFSTQVLCSFWPLSKVFPHLG